LDSGHMPRRRNPRRPTGVDARNSRLRTHWLFALALRGYAGRGVRRSRRLRKRPEFRRRSTEPRSRRSSRRSGAKSEVVRNGKAVAGRCHERLTVAEEAINHRQKRNLARYDESKNTFGKAGNAKQARRITQ